MQNRKSKLLQLIDEKLAETKTSKRKRSKPPRSPKADSNRKNYEKSTGPKSPEGKAKASANSLKHGFFANVENLHPHDSPAFQQTLSDLRMGLAPDGPVEEQLIRELAMFSTRLQRLEAAEYALIASGIETNPSDAREIATAFANNAAALDQLHKAEIHLRRAYNRTWDRLERMQKERLKLPLDEALKRSQIWATYEALRTNCPKCTGSSETTSSTDVLHEAGKRPIPARHPAIDEKGKLIKYPPGHPMYRPKQADEDQHAQTPTWPEADVDDAA